MKKVILVIFTVSILLSSYCGKQAVQITDEEIAIKNVITDFYKKFDFKDLPGVVAYCSDDFQWYSINGLILKKDQLVEFFTPISANWKTIVTDVNVFDIKVEGRMAVARFGTRMQINNEIKTMKNLHTMVFVYQFGEWKIWHHQESMQ